MLLTLEDALQRLQFILIVSKALSSCQPKNSTVFSPQRAENSWENRIHFGIHGKQRTEGVSAISNSKKKFTKETSCHMITTSMFFYLISKHIQHRTKIKQCV